MFTYRCTLVSLLCWPVGLGRSQVTKLWATSLHRRVPSQVAVALATCGFYSKEPNHWEPITSRIALLTFPAHTQYSWTQWLMVYCPMTLLLQWCAPEWLSATGVLPCLPAALCPGLNLNLRTSATLQNSDSLQALRIWRSSTSWSQTPPLVLSCLG